MSALLDLAERVEKAAGADRELDERIGMSIGLKRTVWVGHQCLGNYRQVPVMCPAYTASLDAALSLVGPASYWRLGNDGEGHDPAAFKATVTSGEGPSLTFHDATAATPALALVSAALRARHSLEQQS